MCTHTLTIYESKHDFDEYNRYIQISTHGIYRQHARNSFHILHILDIEKKALCIQVGPTEIS